MNGPRVNNAPKTVTKSPAPAKKKAPVASTRNTRTAPKKKAPRSTRTAGSSGINRANNKPAPQQTGRPDNKELRRRMGTYQPLSQERRQASNELARRSHHTDLRPKDFRTMAEEVFGEGIAKQRYLDDIGQRVQRMDLTDTGYSHLRKKASEPWTKDSWSAVQAGLGAGNKDAISAVSGLLDDAKTTGLYNNLNWGGEHRRQAEALIKRHAPAPSAGPVKTPEFHHAFVDGMNDTEKLGVGDYWGDRTNLERQTLNDRLTDLDASGQRQLMIDGGNEQPGLADNNIADREKRERQAPHNRPEWQDIKGPWLQQFRPDVRAELEKMPESQQALMAQRTMGMRRNDPALRHVNDLQITDAPATSVKNALTRSTLNDSVGRQLRYEDRMKSGQLSYDGYLQLTGGQIKEMRGREQHTAKNNERERNAELQNKIGTIMGDKALEEVGKRSGEQWRSMQRTGGQDLLAQGKGFLEAGPKMVKGLYDLGKNLVTDFPGTMSAMGDMIKNPQRLLVAADRAWSTDPARASGHLMFDMALTAGSLGMAGPGTSALDKGLKVARYADDAARIGNKTKALRYVDDLEGMAKKARKAADGKKATPQMRDMATQLERNAERARKSVDGIVDDIEGKRLTWRNETFEAAAKRLRNRDLKLQERAIDSAKGVRTQADEIRKLADKDPAAALREVDKLRGSVENMRRAGEGFTDPKVIAALREAEREASRARVAGQAAFDKLKQGPHRPLPKATGGADGKFLAPKIGAYDKVADAAFGQKMAKAVDQAEGELQALMKRGNVTPEEIDGVLQRIGETRRNIAKQNVETKIKNGEIPKSKWAEERARADKYGQPLTGSFKETDRMIDPVVQGKYRHQEFYDRAKAFAQTLEDSDVPHELNIMRNGVEETVPLTQTVHGSKWWDDAPEMYVTEHPVDGQAMKLSQRGRELFAEVLNNPALSEQEGFQKLAEAHYLMMHGTPYKLGSPAGVESLLDATLRTRFGRTLPPKAPGIEPFWEAMFQAPGQEGLANYIKNFRNFYEN